MKLDEILKEVDPGFEKFLKKSLPVRPSDGRKDMSMMQAFGSDEYNKLHEIGIRFYEKPDYWEDLDSSSPSGKYKPLTQAQIDKAEKALGVPFKVYTQDKVFGSGQGKSKTSSAKDGWAPMSDAKKQEEPIYIVHMKDGTRYLVDGTQANTYIRLWAKIKD